ncbi:hypothetical protein SETIT_4G140500v2 [Setaria italica]|uniref:Major facilitator superfamily (MFS) profile domain-containing protein n=2 Tax=Setaria italica TaxID=4555 RepID=A0A368QVY5_SETIT|nr:hypothetical protein SETIT_4G140500v2 [Setaria italica]RCV21451.1 hypothetical protein SETIT_4G140500v2 [Setaria italica]
MDTSKIEIVTTTAQMDTSEIEIVTSPVPNIMESPKTSSISMTPLQDEFFGSSPSNNETENTTPSLYTKDGTVDFRGTPAVNATTGGKRTSAILLVNYALMNLAFGGVAVDLVMFLRRVLRQENAAAANAISKWTGTVYIFSLFGAFLSDSYMGRYITCIVFQVIYIVGLVMLSLSSVFFLVVPSRCGDGVGLRPCQPPSHLGIVMFQLSAYTTAFGIGGYQPSVATFGADQFDDSDNSERGSKLAFFSYFYMALNIGSLFSNTFLAFYEDKGMWVRGFWASTAAAALGLLVFLLGTPYYRHYKPTGNPLTRMAQVFTAAFRKRHIQTPPGENLHDVEDGEDSGVPGIRKLLHRDRFRCLDKAAIATEEDYHAGNTKNPWRLCTVTQVEEVKCILGLIPIWICTIIYSLEYTQMGSTFVEQGTAMDTNLFGKFRVPAASMSVFDIISVILSVLAYRFVIAPMASRFTKNPDGITDLQRMGSGLIIALIGMLAAAVVEIYRRRHIVATDQPSPMSVLWQAPQYALIGASEVFMYIGQLDFFSGQMPDGMKCLGSSLCMASISLGNFVSMLTVSTVNAITGRRRNRGWITKNINHGHLERFFLLLVGLSVLDFIIFVVFAIIYKGTQFKEGRRHISH